MRSGALHLLTQRSLSFSVHVASELRGPQQRLCLAYEHRRFDVLSTRSSKHQDCAEAIA